MVTVVSARTRAERQAIRTLVREFADWATGTIVPDAIEPPPVLAKLGEELANLPRKYTDPDGALFLASVDGQVAGCIGGGMIITVLRSLGFGSDSASRGHGVGEALVQQLLATAWSVGHEQVILRSHKGMTSARHIYHRARFADMDGVGVCPEFIDIEIAMARALG